MSQHYVSDVNDWTYGNDPANDTTDEVRFLVGDTDVNEKLITDTEVAYAIAKEPNTLAAAVRIARAIAARFAREHASSGGAISSTLSEKFRQYKELTLELEQRAGLLGGISAGGISIADKEAIEDDTDRVRPAFRTGMLSNQGTTSGPEYDDGWD